MPSLVPVSRYLFVGPDEKHFDMKKSGKVKKLVYALLDFLLMKKESKFFDFDFEIVLKPSTGFNSVVAKSIVSYRNEKPDKEFRVKLKTESDIDYDLIAKKTLTLFEEAAQSTLVEYCKCVEFDGTRGAAEELINKSNAIVYYYEPGIKVDKQFEKELKYIERKKPLGINLYENLTGNELTGNTVPGIRKRASGITYSYRLNINLPSGENFKEEKANYLTVLQAQEAREIRLLEKLYQAVEPCNLTFGEVIKEYILGKSEQPALQKKYTQYFKSFIKGQDVERAKISSFAELPLRTGTYHSLKLRFEQDGRYKKENSNFHGLTDKYKQGYYAFLSNVFDYAYQMKYIPYQPLLLIDLNE